MPKRPSPLDSLLPAKVFRVVSRALVGAYRRTGGRVGGKWRIGGGFRMPVPTLLLEYRGRKSGRLFATPLRYTTDGPNVIVVASQGGRPVRLG
jgi:F420H(2)-dependent quinone reductase